MLLSNMRTASHTSEPGHGATDSTRPDRADRRPLPPGPDGGYVFEHVLPFLRDPLASIDQLGERFGDTAMVRFGPYRFIFVSNPEAVHHVLVSNHKNYVKSRSYEGLRLVMGNGLVTSEGAFWKRQRKLSQPAFHRQRLEGLAQTMAACVERTAARWQQLASSRPAKLDLHEEMMRLTLGIVGQTLFGIDLTDESNRLGPAISTLLHHANEYAESIVRVPLWMPTPANIRFRRAKAILDETVHRIIAERRAHGRDEGDLLSMLMGATDESGSDRMTDAQLRDEVMTLFLAGHETIATAMSWTFLLLSQHPEVVARMRAEITDTLGDAPVTFATLPQLEYTGWVINESMRVYPPVWIVERQALAPDEVGGYRIPQGAIVAVAPWALHRSPALWREPERFDPERFSPKRSEGRKKYAYLPFGGGPRVCIGNHFALMEAKIIVATLIRGFDVDVQHVPPPTPDPRVTLRPKSGMPATITVR